MAAAITTDARAGAARPWYKILYVQVLIAILLGVVVGWLAPTIATNDWIKALGDGFIKLIKMVIAPIIFCTVVSGISHIQDARKVGRVGVKALVYFEIVSSLALMIGLLVGNLIPVGRGLAVNPDAAAVATYVKQAEAQKSVDFVLNIIPDSVVGALARGDILQVLLFAILFGFALMALGERGVWRDRHRHEGGADRRLWCDRLHHREIRTRRTRQSGRTDRGVLHDRGAVRIRRARADCAARWL